MTEPPKTMRGILLTGHGGLDRLEIRDNLPVPVPGPRDVLVQVAAAGINNTDINLRTGWYSKKGNDTDDAGWSGEAVAFPRIQGADVCGRIVAVGQQISTERIGERVLIEPCLREADGRQLQRPRYLGSDCDGGFAEYTTVASRHACRVESTLSDVELASFPCSYSTAENLLTRAGVGAGELVLVTGASGGVGSAAVQLARTRGARVIAVTSPAKAPALRRLGAERTLSREEHPTAALGRDAVDVVVDLVGGRHFPELLETLRPGGRYAVAGAIGGPLVSLDLRTLYLKDLRMVGCTVLDPGVFSRLVEHIEQNRLVPVVAGVYPMDGIAAAQTAFLSKQHIGKFVLSVASGTVTP